MQSLRGGNARILYVVHARMVVDRLARGKARSMGSHWYLRNRKSEAQICNTRLLQ